MQTRENNCQVKKFSLHPSFYLIHLLQSKHLKGQLGPRVGNVTFFNHGGQLGPCVGNVTFFNHGGFSWFLVGFHGFQDSFMVFGWFPWFFKVVSWFFMGFGLFPWFFKVFYGFWLVSMVF